MEQLSKIHRELEAKYLYHDWPSQIKQVQVLTEVHGGLGDISAAAKIIDIIKSMNSDIQIDWIITKDYNFDPKQFLRDLERVKISISPRNLPNADLLIIGPYVCGRQRDHVKGAKFAFMECGSKNMDWIEMGLRLDDYKKIHEIFFFSTYHPNCGLVMGLKDGMGLLFDKSRINNTISKENLINSLLDGTLKLSINSYYNQNDWSINSGYAHKPNSWAKFIDFVCTHEKILNVIIILNCHGEFDQLTEQEFEKKILTTKRITFLKSFGYEEITLNGRNLTQNIFNNLFTFLKGRNSTESGPNKSRKLVIIIKPKFFQPDMKRIQLLSDRILATGNNSPAEAIACKCKLYLYEDVHNGGVTPEFAREQIELAKIIYQPLAELLEIFSSNFTPLSKDQMNRCIEILQDPKLSSATIEFCQTAINKFSFDDIFKASLLRTMWHYVNPQLLLDEINSIDQEKKQKIIDITNKKINKIN